MAAPSATPEVAVRQAVAADTTVVAAVLQEAARWVESRRTTPWIAEALGLAFVAPAIARGEVLITEISGEVAAVAMLQAEDTLFWPDRPPGEAGYLRKLAVRRAYAGRGAPAALIADARRRVLDLGRAWLRLDCDLALAGYYARLGFDKVDEIEVDLPDVGPSRIARMQARA